MTLKRRAVTARTGCAMTCPLRCCVCRKTTRLYPAGWFWKPLPSRFPRLYFELYALDIPALPLPAVLDWDAVDAAMEGHLLSRARLAVSLERNPTHDDR